MLLTRHQRKRRPGPRTANTRRTTSKRLPTTMATSAANRLALRCGGFRQHRGVTRLLFIALSFAPTLHTSDGASVRQYGCKQQNYCNGHGTCVAPSPGTPRAICECFETWGAPTDPVQPSNDCTLSKISLCTRCPMPFPPPLPPHPPAYPRASSQERARLDPQWPTSLRVTRRGTRWWSALTLAVATGNPGCANA